MNKPHTHVTQIIQPQTGEAAAPKAQSDSKLGTVTFVVFALCFIAVMVMGTVKLGMVLFG